MELEPSGIHPDDDPPPVGDPIVREVDAALDEGREADALALAEAALAEGRGPRLDLLFLCGDALLALGDPAGAERRFREVLAEDPSCPSSNCWLAMALYRQCRFAEAEAFAATARALPDALPDAHVVSGLLLERQGDFAGADAALRRAAELDPAKYQAPRRLSRADFDREVKKAVKLLPKQFRRPLDRVPIIVQDVPEEHLLRDEDGNGVSDPDLLGLFDGVPLHETDSLGGEIPRLSYIYLFQRNIERYARDPQDLLEQIRITLYHEIGHYLGFDEDELDGLGLA